VHCPALQEKPNAQAAQRFAALPHCSGVWLAAGTHTSFAQHPAQVAGLHVGGGVTHRPCWQLSPGAHASTELGKRHAPLTQVPAEENTLRCAPSLQLAAGATVHATPAHGSATQAPAWHPFAHGVSRAA
jgi:hypothetical protein